MTTHRMHGSPTYLSWRAMKARCGNPNDPAFANYGGRGITFDPAWAQFEAFLDDMGVRPSRCELERKDVNLGYNKDNCRWATPREQSANRRTTCFVEIDGERMPLTWAAAKYGIKPDTLYHRVRYQKMDPKAACLLPVRNVKKEKPHANEA